MNLRIWPLAFLAPVVLAGTLLLAHPMGNFSVSHYSRIEPARDGALIRYVLDLAEIPTFQLLQQWQLEATSPQAELERHAAEQARQWSGNLKIELDGHAMKPRFERATLVLDKGAGGMAIMRVIAELHVDGTPGQLHFEDANFPDRAGWKEIVIVPGSDAVLDRATPIGSDRSHELTAYPQDPLLAPPQDLSATVAWHATPIATPPTMTAAAPAAPAAPMATPAPAAAPEVPPATSSLQPNQAGAGMVVRDDFLSKLLHRGEIGWGMMLVGMAVAFGLGSVHALSPGHGKTIVAAYLVGARGTAKHALFLGGMVTFTHTISVFFLGLVTLFLSRYVLPEKIFPVLGAISGGSIVWIGATLLYKRIRVAFFGDGMHHHTHTHDHDHTHTHTHDHGGLAHDHGDGHVHSHVPEGEISMSSLIALGASGGLVPCPSALVLLLSSVALGRVGLGLTLLVAFSTGLAVVLSGIGLVVLYAKNLLPDSKNKTRNAVFRYLPVASAAVIVCAGILMTGVALGVIRPIAGI